MTLSLTYEKSEQLIRLLTDGLVGIKDMTGEFLLRLNDGTVIDTKGWAGWEWTHGVALTALYHHAAIDPTSAAARHSAQVALEWFGHQRSRFEKERGAPRNINTMAPFYALAGFLSQGVDGQTWQREWCEEWARWLMDELPRTQEGGFQHVTYVSQHKDQLWDDTLMMSALPLAKLGKLLARPDYIDEATYQFLVHVQYLMDPITGLWYHGWQFTPDAAASAGHRFAGAFWARGNCWITLAVPLFLETTDVAPSTRSLLVSTLGRQIDALVRLQDPETGMWHTVLDDATSYVETSATAGFAAGMLAALRMGLISGSHYVSSALGALSAVITRIDATTGELSGVSFGTPMGDTVDFYKQIPITSMPYGQALAMMALVEWERWQKTA